MHIGVFSSNYMPHPGGLEVLVRGLSAGLARRHRVTVLTTAWDGVSGTSEEDGLTVHRIPAVHSGEIHFGIPYPLPIGPGLREALRAMRDVDVIHAHGSLYATTLLAASVARRIGRPLVLTEHAGWVQYRRAVVNAIEHAAWRVLGRRAVAAADAVTTRNTRVRDWLQARFPGRVVQYIPNGVNPAAFTPAPAGSVPALRRSFGLPLDGPLVLFAGRESEKKNSAFVLAMPRTGFHLVVCGAERGVTGPDVTDLGVVPHARMVDLLRCVDVVVHPSSSETFPLALQEAVSVGVPSVVLWDPGYAAGLSPDAVVACHSLDEVAREVARLAGDAAARAALRVRARRWAERQWHWDATVREYEAVFDTVLGRRRDHAA